MSGVGTTYVDVDNDRSYQCTARIVISPTLITDKPTEFGVWKDVTYTSGGTPSNTIVLEDEEGNRVVAVLVNEEVDFTATANDIREGKVAATDDGVTVGEKFIPAYHTSQGFKIITAGKQCSLTGFEDYDLYDYTKFQAILCPFNKSMAKSVGAEIVSIENGVYNVQSTDLLASVTKNHDSKVIDLGITNEFGVPCIVRYITYKEVD